MVQTSTKSTWSCNLVLLLPILPQHATNFTDIQDQLLQISPVERKLMDEVMTIMKLIMMMPATNERSFSAMCRVKSYLRSTMKQERLNHLMFLNVLI